MLHYNIDDTANEVAFNFDLCFNDNVFER
jgi:hypothetical protein